MNHISKKNAVTGKNSEIGPKLAGTFFINSYEKCQKLGHSSKMQGQKNCPSFLRLWRNLSEKQALKAEMSLIATGEQGARVDETNHETPLKICKNLGDGPLCAVGKDGVFSVRLGRGGW